MTNVPRLRAVAALQAEVGAVSVGIDIANVDAVNQQGGSPTRPRPGAAAALQSVRAAASLVKLATWRLSRRPPTALACQPLGSAQPQPVEAP